VVEFGEPVNQGHVLLVVAFVAILVMGGVEAMEYILLDDECTGTRQADKAR